MMQTPAIHLQSVEQSFQSRDRQNFKALDNVNFTVRRHEFVSLIGPSGCGKSTILRLIAGLLRPSKGTINVFGHPINEPRNDVGLVFQRPTLLPWLSTLDNVTFPARHQKGRVSKVDEKKGLELLDMVGLGDFTKRRPNELSGGMQQRVAIARALFQDPDILLMDEPFSALDALTRDEMSLELLRILNEKPKTVVFVTHSVHEALLLSDRIIVMASRPGRIIEIRPVEFSRPRGLQTMLDPRFNIAAGEIRQQVFGFGEKTL